MISNASQAAIRSASARAGSKIRKKVARNTRHASDVVRVGVLSAKDFLGGLVFGSNGKAVKNRKAGKVHKTKRRAS